MAVLTWLAVDDDALLMVGVAGGGQLVVQHVRELLHPDLSGHHAALHCKSNIGDESIDRCIDLSISKIVIMSGILFINHIII